MLGGIGLKLRNKVLLGICLLFLIGTFTGCGTGNEKGDIYNDNDRISRDGDSYSYTGRSQSSSNNQITVKYGKFSGADTIWIVESKGDCEITFDYDSQVESGDFKGVLITPEKQVETVLEGTEDGEKTIKLAEGEYRFKFVGSKAKGKIKISIEESKNVKVRQVDN